MGIIMEVFNPIHSYGLRVYVAKYYCPLNHKDVSPTS